MLTSRYLTSVKNLPAILRKIIEGTAPEKFNREHLKGLGFKSSGDRAIVPLLKDLGFLSADGTPTKRYHDFRDSSRSAEVLGKALLETYGDVFTINENPTTRDRKAIEGKFKSVHNVSDRVAQLQALTFFALLKQADLDAARNETETDEEIEAEPADETAPPEKAPVRHSAVTPSAVGLRYNIEVHLPPSKDIEVYNAIFRSLKEHLLDA